MNLNVTPSWCAPPFTFAVSLASGITFGLAPASTATRSDLSSTLKEGALAQTRGFRRFGLRNLLMVAQVAGSLMLLLLAGFLIFGFEETNRVKIAFDPQKMYLISIDPVRDGYTAEKQRIFDPPGSAEALARSAASRAHGRSAFRTPSGDF